MRGGGSREDQITWEPGDPGEGSSFHAKVLMRGFAGF